MSNILQQPTPAAIGQTPDADSEIPDDRIPADTRYDWIREEWAQNKSADRYRLETVDRALHAADGLQRILIREHRGRTLQEAAPDQLFHDGLDQAEMDSTYEAVKLLIHMAIDNLEHVRTRAGGKP